MSSKVEESLILKRTRLVRDVSTSLDMANMRCFMTVIGEEIVYQRS